MKQTMKRGFSFVLALCMVLSLIVMPKAIVAHAEGVADILSEHVYYHSMDGLAPESDSGVAYENYYPLNWSYSNKYNNINASTIVTEGNDTYYQMKMGANATSRDPLATYTITTEDGVGSNAVLKYRLMVDNSAVTESWEVWIPILAAQPGGRTLTLKIVPTDTDGVYSLTNGTDSYSWEEGKWYDVELIVSNDGLAWALWVEGTEVFTGTQKSTTRVTNEYINMGFKRGNNKDVSLCVDELYIYNYVAGTGFAAAEESYSVLVDGTVATGWTKSSADAYLPSVRFASSNETVATVDENGVVTGVSEGQATITATPAKSSGLPAASVNVLVAAASIPGIPGELGELLVSDSMDTIDGYYPTGWTKSSQAQNALGSSIVSSVGRTYYQMKRSGGEGNGISFATTNPISDYSAVVLKYDVMVDNGDITEFSVFLPAFTDAVRSRAIPLIIKDGVLSKTEKTMTPGTWYTFVLILDGSDWKLFVDGEKVLEDTLAEGKTITCLNMGISNTGGNPAEGQSDGANVAMNIDNFTVYEYIPETDVEQNVATVGGQGYATVQDAVNYAVENGGTVVLQSSTDETITVAADKELFIDFNGNTVGEITVNGTLYGIDATTKDYTAEPLKVKVIVNGTVAPVYKVDDGSKAHAYAGYAAKVDEDGYATFNYFELKISSVTLRPGDAGIGYKLDLAGNVNVKAMLDAEDAFGVRVYRYDNSEGGKKASAGADSFDAGTQTKMVMIKNILSDAAEAVEQNATNLDVKLCVEAYMNIGGETVAVSFAKGTNLREVLVAVNATVGKLNDTLNVTQKGELGTMYEKYDLGNAAYKLDISAIAGLASSKEG